MADGFQSPFDRGQLLNARTYGIKREACLMELNLIRGSINAHQGTRLQRRYWRRAEDYSNTHR